MRHSVQQGDILKIEKINRPTLVVSKDFFNKTGEIIGCPIYDNGEEGPLHIKIEVDKKAGYVHCEKLALLDLNARRFSKIAEVNVMERIDIIDAIQGIFDYV